MTYSIQFRRSARKELEDLPPDAVRDIVKSITNLAIEPRPQGCKKLLGVKNLWRIRIGDYRVVYEIDDKGRVIIIEIIAHRKDVYRK
jgi:mRNA interferase RelE/StbE